MEQDEYDRMAAAEDVHWWYGATRSLLSDLVAPFLLPGGRFLDAGGGTGSTGAWLARCGRLVAIDLEPRALSLYRQGHPDVVGFAGADVRRLPFADDVFDAVVSVTVLYHASIGFPSVAVGEFARVVRPGGVIALMEPGVRRLERSHDRHTHAGRRFSLGQLRRLLVDNGVAVERATGAYTFLVPAAAVLAAVERGRSSSDLDRDPGGFRGLLPAAARAERAALRRVHAPFGLSVLALGRVRV